MSAIVYTLNKFYLINGVHYQTAIFYTNLFAGAASWSQVPPWEIVKETLNIAVAHGPYLWFVLLGFIFIPMIGSFALFQKSYQLIEPTYVSIIYSLDPVMATFLGYVILNQSLSSMQLIGMLIILVPVVYIQYKEGRQETALDNILVKSVLENTLDGKN